ncbi:hypothetical protein GM658_14240 [Pseudoduganella eburnea]|uniref:Uncharacterized protein n=1 Tax=Massilia eburnea TaxID=1776165 RepID=A0A6L6QHA5_9BURK|nr:hypothetical protein [Massilia eburnea]MTW11762.1 hypothetical protein [Massilia eburnea]
MVLVERDASTAIFALTLSLEKVLPPNSSLQVEFEDPTAPDALFVVSGSVNEKGLLLAQSPKFEGLRNKRAYLARTKVLGADQQVLSIHDQWIWFNMPNELRKFYATKIID